MVLGLWKDKLPWVAGAALFLVCTVTMPLAGQEAGLPALSAGLKEAQELIQKGDLATARVRLQTLANQFPKEPAVHNLLGVVEAQSGNYRPAEQRFRKAVALAPQYEGALLNLGRLYQERTGTDPEAADKAVAIYLQILTVNPASLEAPYQLAVLFHGKGQFSTSLEYLRQLPASHHNLAQTLALFCANYVGTGEIEKAREAAERLGAAGDLAEPDVISILPWLVTRQAFEIATLLLEALDRRGLASAAGLYQLGLLYQQQNKLLQARAVLLKAAELKPDTVPILAELARVAEAQADYTSALSFLAHARALEPRNAAVHFAFGVVCLQMNLLVEAQQSLGRALELEPENPRFNYAMGVAAEARTQHREAVKHFQKYRQLKPDDVRGRLALGVAYFYSHEPEAARRELEACVLQSETSAAAHYFLARLAGQQDRFEEAFQELETTLKLAPNFADAYAELGHLHLKRREYEKAEAALEKALALEPESYQANLYLTMLYSRTRDPRAAEQTRAFEELKKRKSEKVKEFYRMVEVRPLG